ncbi:LytR/AlgR family response regulator transcription factor [Aureispira anguillae]|uniref:Response regulator transcription factor n=1 Tax=Aureispira anguillae TaxID=2864201 RepID=A0A916DRL7_9BACT|nr:response regulator transcription factor [Aureispira anguillae]BDS10720.1 response regulator transcription factor [Aureispira anguillae]
MNCIIIEDQPPAQRILKKYIKDVGSLTLKATFLDAIEAIEYLKSERVDLVFLDIHLPKISGIDFLKIMSQPPLIILTTAFQDYALESYEFDVVDYLLKPFSFQRFVKAITKAAERNTLMSSKITTEPTAVLKKELFIKSGYEHFKVVIDDIIYIKSDADYSEIFVGNKKYLSPKPLRYWEENLQAHQFTRIHKSYIMNGSKIDKITATQIFLFGGIVLPIGRAYKEMVAKYLSGYK